LLEPDVIRQKRRVALEASFDHFGKNHEEQFWTHRALEIIFQKSAIRAGFQQNEVGVVETKIAFANVLSKRLKVLEEARQEGDYTLRLMPPL